MSSGEARDLRQMEDVVTDICQFTGSDNTLHVVIDVHCGERINRERALVPFQVPFRRVTTAGAATGLQSVSHFSLARLQQFSVRNETSSFICPIFGL